MTDGVTDGARRRSAGRVHGRRQAFVLIPLAHVDGGVDAPTAMATQPPSPMPFLLPQFMQISC